MNPATLQNDVAQANERLRGGDTPADVPCPKCHNPRYVATETLGSYPMATCACCGFSWFVV